MTSSDDSGRKPSPGKASPRSSTTILNWSAPFFLTWVNVTRCLLPSTITDPPPLRQLCDDSLSWCGRRIASHVSSVSIFRNYERILTASIISPTLSYQRLQVTHPLTDEELYDKIRRSVQNKHELQVLESFLIFNKCVSSPLYAIYCISSGRALGMSSRPTSISPPRLRCRSASLLTSCPRSSTPGSLLGCSL